MRALCFVAWATSLMLRGRTSKAAVASASPSRSTVPLTRIWRPISGQEKHRAALGQRFRSCDLGLSPCVMKMKPWSTAARSMTRREGAPSTSTVASVMSAGSKGLVAIQSACQPTKAASGSVPSRTASMPSRRKRARSAPLERGLSGSVTHTLSLRRVIVSGGARPGDGRKFGGQRADQRRGPVDQIEMPALVAGQVESAAGDIGPLHRLLLAHFGVGGADEGGDRGAQCGDQAALVGLDEMEVRTDAREQEGAQLGVLEHRGGRAAQPGDFGQHTVVVTPMNRLAALPMRRR